MSYKPNIGDKIRIIHEGTVTKIDRGYFSVDCGGHTPFSVGIEPWGRNRKIEVLESPWRVCDHLRVKGGGLNEYKILYADDDGYLIVEISHPLNKYYFPKSLAHLYDRVTA